MTASEPLASEGRNPRVLLIEDHALSNRVMTLVLRMRGFSCKAVTSETQALAAIEDFKPDVVILEWANRWDREVERAARIRAHARAVGVPVAIIVVTHEVARPSADVLGNVDGYFTKPVVLESLEQAILRVTAPIHRAQVG
jgi:two-component system, OmpR family, response regulator